MRPAVRARPPLRLRRVLRPARGRVRVRRRHPRVRSRPARSRSGATPALLPVPADIAEHPPARRRLHPPRARRQPRRRARHEAAVGQGRLRQPDALVQGPRRRRRAVGRQQLGFTTVACASTGNLANAVAAAASRAGLQSCVVIPTDLEDGKIITTAVYGGTLIAVEGTYDDVNRLCSEVAGESDWGFVNVNLRPFYAEGSKTLGYEIAEQLGWRLPEQVVIPIASGSLLTKVDKAFRELIKLGLVEDTPVQDLRRPGHGLLAGRRRRSRTARTSSAGQAATPSPSRWPSATRPTARTRSTSPAAPAVRSRTSATTRSSRASGCWPRPRASSPRPPAASPSATCASCSRRASSTPTPRPSSSTPVTGSRRSTRSRRWSVRPPPSARPSTRSASPSPRQVCCERLRPRPDHPAHLHRRRRRGHRRRRATARRCRASSTRSRPTTRASARASSTTRASCAASSTSTSATRTSASPTASTTPVAGRLVGLGHPGRRRRLLTRAVTPCSAGSHDASGRHAWPGGYPRVAREEEHAWLRAPSRGSRPTRATASSRPTTAVDVFVHYSPIVTDGQRVLEAGQRVEFEVSHGERGPQADNVRVIG